MLVTPLFADNYEDNLKRWEQFVDRNQWGELVRFLAGEEDLFWLGESHFDFWIWG